MTLIFLLLRYVIDFVRWKEVVDAHNATLHRSWDDLPHGGYYIEEKPARVKKVVFPRLQRHYYYIMHSFKIPRRALESLDPLSSRPASPTGVHTPSLLCQLPYEMLANIVKMVIEPEWPNRMKTLLDLRRVCRRLAAIVRNEAACWASAFRSITTPAQAYIVHLLAKNRPLDFSCLLLHPYDVSPWINAAGRMDVCGDYVEDWIEACGENPLPRLRQLECSYHETLLRLRAPQLQFLTVAGPTEFIAVGNLQIARLAAGFGREDIDRAVREFLPHCQHLKELRIDNRYNHNAGDAYCWHNMLKALNGSHLRELQLDDYDGCHADCVHDELDLPRLEVLKTCSVLLVNAPHVVHVELWPHRLADLTAMASRLSKTKYLHVTMCNSYDPSSPAVSDIVGGDITFEDLHVLECKSSLDARFIQFLAACTFARAPRLHTTLDMSTSMHAVSGWDPKGACDCKAGRSNDRPHVQPLSRYRVDYQTEILDSLRSVVERGVRPGAKLNINAKVDVICGASPSFLFSVDNGEVDWLHTAMDQPRFASINLRVPDIQTSHCECTVREGFPVTPVHLLSAFAVENVTELHMSLQTDIGTGNPHCPWGSLSKAFDVNVLGYGLNNWTAPDALATPHPMDFALLRRNLLAMSNTKKWEIEVVRSNELRGLGAVEALVAQNEEELLHNVSPVTCPRLEDIILKAEEAGERKALRYAGTLKDQLHRLGTVRSKLAKRGLCVTPRFVFGPNFCSCRTPERDGAFIRTLRALGVEVHVVQSKDGCKHCA